MVGPLARLDGIWEDISEDALTTRVADRLLPVFQSLAEQLTPTDRSSVRILRKIHAGLKRDALTGSDLGIWIGPVPRDLLDKVDRYVNSSVGLDEIPPLVGLGTLIQAKRWDGKVKRQDTEKLRGYAQRHHLRAVFSSLNAKALMIYRREATSVQVCEPPYIPETLAHLAERKTESVDVRPLHERLQSRLGDNAFRILRDFTGHLLSFAYGSPLLTLCDILVADRALIVPLPPEPPGGPPPLDGALRRRQALLLQKWKEQECEHTQGQARRHKVRYR